jgi:hypothetical protein
MKMTIKQTVQNGDWKKSFSVARKFFFGLNADEKRSIEIASDTIGNAARQDFYSRLGVDWLAETENAKRIILAKFG